MIKTQVLVIGSGPGGYTAASRAADLGNEVTLGESYITLGGVCLNEGCSPSKTHLHSSEVMIKAKQANELGVSFKST